MSSPTFQLRLFGEFDLRVNGVTRALGSARVEMLLALLALRREAALPRQRVAFQMWPDSTEPQARTNLRHVLHALRHALPEADAVLEITPATLQWRAEAASWFDVAIFEAASSGRETGDDLDSLRDAVELYAGDLLAGRYDEWILADRERLRQRCLDMLEQLVTSFEARAEHALAIVYAERLLRHDPLHEQTYRLLMRLHDARGDRARALRVYHICAATLQRELGVAPSPATRATYDALLPIERAASAVEPTTVRPGGLLVGRATERAQLTALWRTVEQGRAHFVLVSGEPGIGKTQLVDEFRSWCAHRGALTADARSYRAEGALAYGPVTDWLRSEAFSSRVARLDPTQRTELARLLPQLLVDDPQLAHPAALTAQDQRQRMFDALTHALLAPDAAVLLVADDLHWCDPETMRFLHYLLRRAPDARLLVAATARREEFDAEHPLNDLIASLRAAERFSELELGRLSRIETAALAERHVGRTLDPADIDRLFAETDGNPLFILEALRAGREQAGAADGWLTPKVQAVIESRLALLSQSAQQLVGVAATIGREFTLDLLARASGADTDALVAGLDETWRRGIVREHGEGYDFSHDKVREVAYRRLGPARRRQLHLRVAKALEQLRAHDPSLVSGELAAQFEQAGAAEQAIGWYRRAAEAAQQLHANAEALRLLRRALELVRTLPDSPARQAGELAILTALPATLLALDGYHSSRLSEAHARALELTRLLGGMPDPRLLRSLAVASLSHDDFDAARQFGEQLRDYGTQAGDDMLLVQSDYVGGIAAFWQGELTTARRHFEAALGRYHADQRQAHLLAYGHDPKVACMMRLALTLGLLGHSRDAAQARDEALAWAVESGQPYDRAVGLVFGLLLALEFRDVQRLRRDTATLAAEHATRDAWHVQVAAEAFTGYLEAVDGEGKAGVARIQHALADPRAAEQPAPGLEAFIVRVLLEACAVAGDTCAGLQAADRLLNLGNNHLWDAEARRMRAEFLSVLGGPREEIAAEFEHALHVARHQGARLFELRAAMSLLRQRRAAGDVRAEGLAREDLAAIVAAFPPAPECPDVRQATAMLAPD